jgi:ADP-ribose pyrophosphatase YjhB (NUDIX family)
LALPGSSRANPVIRHGTRVILLDADSRLLLFRGAFPDSETGKPFWVPPGGGMEPGETPEECARRELFEETGRDDAVLGPLIWLREHTATWHDVWYHAVERWYVGYAVEASVTKDGWTEIERADIAEHRWWTAAEIAASPDIFVPRRLAELVPPILRGQLPAEPLDVGV